MAVHNIKWLFGPDGRMRNPDGVWSLYAAFADPVDGRSFVKIGVSTDPRYRAYQINSGSPLTIRAALWAEVGSKRRTMALEQAVHDALTERRTRGEWFSFDVSSTTDKRLFHDTVRRLYFEHTHKALRWRKLTHDQFVDYHSLRSSDERSRKHRR